MFRTLMIGAVSALTLSAAALKASDSFAQGSTFKDQLVGTWTMVSNVNTRPDGTKYEALGRNPRGVFVLDANGRFVITIIGEGRPSFTSNSRLEGTADENKYAVQGAIAYFGTYTVNESDHTLNFHIERSTFPNWDGTDQKRIVTLTGDEMKYTNTAASGGGKAELVWRRANAQQGGTPQEAQAMLNKAVAALKADQAVALAMFIKGENGFLDRDLYPFCFRMADGKLLVSPKAVPAGTDIRSLKDASGNAYGPAIYAGGQKPEGQITEVGPYLFPKPGTTTPAFPKTSFVTKVGELGCGVGYYK